MKSLLDQTRSLLGPAPRSFVEDHLRELHVSPPSWMRRDDVLYSTYTDYDEILETGDVVWGHVVQANAKLFEKGRTDCPAAVLFSQERTFDHGLDRLALAAHQLFELKESRPVSEGYQRVGDHLADEKERVWRMPVPAGISRGKPLFVATIMVHRRHLPLAYLGATFLPLVVAPDIDTVLLLPGALWADDLVEAWRDLSQGSAD